MLTGEGAFTGDRDVLGALHIAFRRSDHPHPLISEISTAAAMSGHSVRVVSPDVGGGFGGKGIGAALYEEIIYNDAGQLLTASLADYVALTANEVPPITTSHLETEAPSTVGGLRGMGEGGTIGAPAAIAKCAGRRASPVWGRNFRAADDPGMPVLSCGKGQGRSARRVGWA